MKTVIVYIENKDYIDIETRLQIIPYFIDREFIEMDYSKIAITCRQEDVKTVEKILSSFV